MSKRPSKPSDNDTLWLVVCVILEILVFVACYYVLGAFDISEHARGLISEFAFVALLLLAIIIGTIATWAFRRRKQKPQTTPFRKSRGKPSGGK
jgi:protein-S-isoprenylcysteine O-methyltransferase Ste14